MEYAGSRDQCHPLRQFGRLLFGGLMSVGALTTLVAQFGDEMRALLGLPDHVVPQAVIPLGMAAHPLGPPRRDPIAEHTHRDRYGNAW